ncbi:PEST proteolytic signal-containing nuclear protein-like isoform X1 [Trichogramma pretiosum]|uniref:PEST proteolytic signal-containing nuclear protein-like isoform X1 n=1 Tax=Trichogramma pretiosum TaxID=7493 RepID=UPI0006C99F88|nr:PEST proteolytic signal-containing nuclear protein-like isoform X1 [Trichogramma pretiosum]
MSNRSNRRDDYDRDDYNKRDDHRRDDYRRDDYRKGSSAYRGEDRRREVEDDNSRTRDRSPHRSHDRYESSSGTDKSSDKQKLAFGFDKKGASSEPKKSGGIQMKLGSSSKFTTPAPSKKHTIASVFNNDDDDEPEEMPAEARMRMRNIGRDTPTSAGPNSFGKTKQGFCDSKKIFEKALKKAMEEAAD